MKIKHIIEVFIEEEIIPGIPISTQGQSICELIKQILDTEKLSAEVFYRGFNHSKPDEE